MNVTAFCITTLVISVVFIIAAIVIGVVINKNELARQPHGRKGGFALTSFHVFLIGFFLAAVAMFFPVYYNDFLSGDHGFVKVVKTVLLSVHNVLRMFVLDGEFDAIRDLLSDTSRVDAAVGAVYTIYASVLFVAAPALSAGVVLSFFKGASAVIKYTLYPRSDIYILSELNDRSIVLARDILTNKADKRRRLVVFTDVFETEEENNFELVSEAKRLGAICMRKDIVDISLKRSKNIFRKIYLIGDDEDENINQALTLIDRCRHTPLYNNLKTQIYVFARSMESEVLLNSIDNGDVKVRRINEYRNMINHTLNNYSIFEDAREVDGQKQISLAIVGLGAYGIELLKAACWFGQMPGYKMTIHAFDNECGTDKIKNIAPELLELNNKNIAGEPYYNIVFHDGIDVKSSKFQDELSKIDLVTTAFVTLGNDELNIEAAMKMRVQFGRDAISSGKHVPPVYAIIYSMSETKAVSQGGLKNMNDEDYGIHFIGSIQSRYTVDSIEMTELELEGLKCHLHWVARVDEEDAIRKYNKYEYYRRSSAAEAMYMKFRSELVSGYDGEQLKEYEHKRWSAYMRSEGFIGLGEGKDYIAKTHASLIPYQELSQAEKDKDDIYVED